MRVSGPQGPRHLLAALCHVPRVLARLPWRRPPGRARRPHNALEMWEPLRLTTAMRV